MPQLQSLSPPPETVRRRPKPFAEQELLSARLERSIRRATGDRVRELHVELCEERIAVFGRCATYYCKQQVQQAAMALIKEEPVLCKLNLENQIEVW